MVTSSQQTPKSPVLWLRFIGDLAVWFTSSSSHHTDDLASSLVSQYLVAISPVTLYIGGKRAWNLEDCLLNTD